MLIVDGQIHLWEKGTPSPQHRQEPYSAEEAIAAMDEAGVDRALIHPVLWDPDSNDLATEAVRKYPERFRIMGWFFLDDPHGAFLVAHWKERLGMVGLRFYFNERHEREWMTDGTLEWLWPAAERRRAGGACRCALPADCRPDRRAPPGPQIDRRPHGGAAGQQRRGRLSLSGGAAGARQIPERCGQGYRSAGLCRGRLSVSQLSRAPAPLL